MNRGSGQFKGKRKIYGGRTLLRSKLFMALIGVVFRLNTSIAFYYRKLITRGNTHKVAMIACVRNVLQWLNSKVKQKKIFDSTLYPSHEKI